MKTKVKKKKTIMKKKILKIYFKNCMEEKKIIFFHKKF